MTEELKKEQNKADETARQKSFIELAKALTDQKSNSLGRPLTYCLTTFGCQMNEKQSEAVAGIMDEIGYNRQDSEEADVVIFHIGGESFFIQGFFVDDQPAAAGRCQQLLTIMADDRSRYRIAFLQEQSRKLAAILCSRCHEDHKPCSLFS